MNILMGGIPKTANGGFSTFYLKSMSPQEVVEYSISKNMSQTMISEYKLKLIDKKLLETKLKEMKNLIDSNDK